MSMQVFTQTITFTTPTGVKTIDDLAKNNFMCTRLFVEPDDANGSEVAVVDVLTNTAGSLGNQNIVAKLRIPDTAHKANLDNFKVIDFKGGNAVDTRQYAFMGATGEKARVTIWVN